MTDKSFRVGPNLVTGSGPASLLAKGMNRRRALGLGLGLGGAFLLGCDPLHYKLPPPLARLGSFPYHPLVFHLDLCVLAYQVHGQSLIWPIDPFYEERTHGNGLDRTTYMSRVSTWAATQGALQVQKGAGLDAYRGPGVLGGFPHNPTHEPIICNYSRIYPWRQTIVNMAGRWTEYLTPSPVTDSIGRALVAFRRIGSTEDDVEVVELPHSPPELKASAEDVLIAFEGGTGDKGEAGQPASQSLMGFVLARSIGEGRYDLHVAFRGSRSGKASRAALDSLSDGQAGGNPDWITDFGWDPVSAADSGGHITTTGSVARGFARAIAIASPTIMRALEEIAAIKGGVRPDHIFVTGHSLGGALAQHFASALLLGDAYGPRGTGPSMPASLKAWPWKNLKLVTYGAPRAGDVQWAHALTTKALQSEFFEAPLSPYDTEARYVGDPELVDRLHAKDRPAALRVLVSTDAITTEKISGGAHVGTTVYVNGALLTGWIGPPSFGAHEPETIRQFMVDGMADPRTPPDAWNYLSLTALDPTRDDARAGSNEEFIKLGRTLREYYEARALWFDETAFESDLQLLLKLG